MAEPLSKKIDVKSGGGRPYKDVTIIDPNQYEDVVEDEDNHDDWIPLNPSSSGDDKSRRTTQPFFSKFRCLVDCPSPPSCSSPSTVPSTVGSLWTGLVFGWFTPVLQAMQSKLDLDESPNLEEDGKIPPLPEEDSTAAVRDVFERLWKQELIDNPDKPSLVRCLWRAFSPLFISAGFLKLTHDCFQFVGPQVLKGLISFLRNPSEDIGIGLGLTAAVTVAQMVMSLCLRHYFFRCYRVGIRIRTAILYALYQKSLRINSTYYQKHSVGQITNLMSVDVERLQGVITYLHAIWYSFLQIVLAMYFLWQQLGPSCLAGVLVIILSIPLTAISAQWMGNLQKKLMEKKDDRVQVNQEIISNMKIVKLQAWEGPFREKITRLRGVEMRQLLFYDLGQACTWLLWSAVPLLIALSTFGAYVAIAGHSLDVASALTALALFEILRFPLFMLPYVINMIVEAGVAVKRIQDFLSAPDYEPPPRLQDGDDNADRPVVQLKDATFTYQCLDKNTRQSKTNPNLTLQDELNATEQELLLIKARLADAEEHLAELEGRPYVRYGSTASNTDSDDGTATKNDFTNGYERILSLRRVNFECFEGEFVAVVGGVGSGKSTLLRSILGEVQKVSGDVGVRGTIAYFDQKAFIMNDTVKGNIVFGKNGEAEFEEDLYNLAVKSACLEHDLEMLPLGDGTEIGEKVRNYCIVSQSMGFSPGVRINSACNGYPKALTCRFFNWHLTVSFPKGITLSGGQKARVAMGRAVYRDADISLLDDCLSAVDAHVGRDLFDKCIIEVLLRKKRKDSTRKRTVILVTNALQYLSNSAISRIVVMKNGMVVESGSYKDLVRQGSSQFKKLLRAFKESMTNGKLEGSGDVGPAEIIAEVPSHVQADVRHSETRKSARLSQTAADVEKKPQQLMTDEMAEREIGKVGREVYMTWARATGGLWVVIPLFVVYSAGECTTILSNWWLTYWSHNAAPDTVSQLHYLGIYGLINVTAIVVDFLRMFVVLFLGLRASTNLFSALLDSTLTAPMSFFDTTPAGRIMNRFSKDINTIDEGLPSSFQMYVDCMFKVMSTLVVVTTVTPWFSVVLIPMLLFYRQQQAYFAQCYRELKRIDSVTRSPIYALFGETLDGYCTIRAFGAEPSLASRIVKLIDKQQHAFFLTQAGLCWLAVRLELIGTSIIFFACMAAVMQKLANPQGNEVFAGLAGLSISYALSVTQSLNWAVRTGSDFEANMVSVERVRQYTHLEQEAPHETEGDKHLSNDWPSKGIIEFHDAELRYRPGLPLVLKGLNITIPGQAKVGIVGRTGAGKSTLMTALMRLVELDGGKIMLDGVDTKNVGLRKLRSNIAVIPQDPVLFSGSIKTNLDPFNQHSNDRLIDVLKSVGMYSDNSESAVKSLEDNVQQDGSNFSAGQRQLLVIARALLDGAAVVICDEATASIDAEADSRIQRVLRTDFAAATTLTVAHRLNTIMDSTHILVMSDGKAVEFDTPGALLSKGGLFKELVDKWEEGHG